MVVIDKALRVISPPDVIEIAPVTSNGVVSIKLTAVAAAAEIVTPLGAPPAVIEVAASS